MAAVVEGGVFSKLESEVGSANGNGNCVLLLPSSRCGEAIKFPIAGKSGGVPSAESEGEMATRIRHAPKDLTLPSPWKALLGVVEGEEYTYYWNPETNVTQYEKPDSSAAAAAGIEESRDLKIEKPEAVDTAETQREGGEKRSNSPDYNWATAPVRSSNVDRGNDRGGITGIKRPCEGLHQNAFKRPKPGFVYPRVASLPEVDVYRRKHEISTQGDNVPQPYTSFASAMLPSVLLKEYDDLLLLEGDHTRRCDVCSNWSQRRKLCCISTKSLELESAGFSSPSPIQAQSWPIAQQGRDIIAVAKTGSGKTLGYLVPAFLHLQRYRDKDCSGPTVLVLAPTRELATQIQAEAKKFGRSLNVSSTCVYGGADKMSQLRDIRKGVDIIIATPGRLNDFLKSGKLSLLGVSYVVLDEADRMLDMGFEPQIRAIFEKLPPERQTLMYTATWPKEVRKMAGDMLHTPVQVNIGSTDDLVANKAITQHVEIIRRNDKMNRLQQILRSQERDSRILVFSSTKRMCDQLARNLSDFKAAAIHGDKTQEARENVLSQFRSGKSPVLVATDVAARGLDVKGIRVVINYDFPTKFEDYIHRIGRTGRGGATGLAYTFFDESQDAKFSKNLVKVLEGANQKVPKALADIAARGGRFF